MYQSHEFQQYVTQTVQQALEEDLGSENLDVTAELIPEGTQASGTLITRENAIICGTEWVDKVFQQLSPQLNIEWQCQTGDKVAAGDTLLTISGCARAILTGERTAMNFLQTLSGTSTTTAEYVAKLVGTNCRLLDTRKTLPGLRMAQKYAVHVGGGENHRIGLYDAFLIKENHIATTGSITNAVNQAKINRPDRKIEVEVENLDELNQALDVGVDVIMLDNFSLDLMRQAVAVNQQHQNKTLLEASGDITLDNINAVAKTGVDYISVGALTKHSNAIDLSLRVNIQ